MNNVIFFTFGFFYTFTGNTQTLCTHGLFNIQYIRYNSNIKTYPLPKNNRWFTAFVSIYNSKLLMCKKAVLPVGLRLALKSIPFKIFNNVQWFLGMKLECLIPALCSLISNFYQFVFRISGHFVKLGCKSSSHPSK